ncbi:MAG TPA: hypothetical protein VGD58_10730 [Herpetosiphonaceae bacterium]
MTQRERIDDADHNANMYETGTNYRQGPAVTQQITPDVDVDVVTPTDRVRWGPIIAGIFTALSTLAVLSVLGLAIGASSFDPGDQARNFGIGAGVWGALSALLAFGLGGWTAARTAAVGGRNNGLLNGTMVWVVGIPLLLYLLSSGVGSLLNTAGSIAGTAATVAAPVAGEAANNPALQATAQAGAQDATGAVQATAQALQNQATDPANQEAAADAVRNGAWGTLASLLLGLAAAALGGYLGARTPNTNSRRAYLG